MKWRKSVAALALAGASAAAGVMGVSAFQNVEFAQARQVVQTAREDLSHVPDLSDVFRSVATAVEPSVVKISVEKTVTVSTGELPPAFRRFFRQFKGEGREGMPDLSPWFNNGTPGGHLNEYSTGSGVIMDAGNGVGYILTNNHVVKSAKEVNVTLADGRQINHAKVVGTDPKTDLAVVEIKEDRLIPAQWGDSTKLQQGDRVMAFGSPFGYVGSMTHGIVSALHRQAGILGRDGYENFIQVDAPINPGNSGGPLVNIHGNVVGINTAIASDSGGFEGIGFAIPSREAKQVYTILKEKGHVTRGWLGIEIINVANSPDEAKSAGYQGKNGVLVHGVLRDSPATEKLRPGDIITALNGKSMNDSRQLRNAIAMTAPGTDATLHVIRNGKAEDLTIKIGQQGGNEAMAMAGKAEHAQKLGLQMVTPSDEQLQKYGLSEKGGALVTLVKPGSVAAMAGLRPGDLITRVGQQKVSDAKQASEALSKANLKDGIKLYVANRQGTEFLFLQSQA